MWRERPRPGLDKRTSALLLLLVLVPAFGLRVWYGSHRPHEHRFEDERYGIANVRTILVDRTFLPASSYYPSPVHNLPLALLVAASDRLAELSGRSGLVAFEDGRFTFHGFLLMRLLQAVYGTAAVGMLFLLGRRLFGPEVGLAAAFLLAFVPWHIHASGYIKPDVLLTLAVLMALYASIRLLERPGWPWAVATGAAVALAASAKMTGVLVAIPVAVATLVLSRREPRRLAWLFAAGAASALAFVSTNPYWRAYPTWIAGLSRDYAMRAGRFEMDSLQVPIKTLEFLGDPYTFGWLLATIALLGLGIVIVALWRAPEPVRRAQLLTLAVFPIIWVAGYAAQTAYFKPNNMLPVLGPLALLAAATLFGLWNAARERFPVLRRGTIAWVIVAVLVVMVVRPGVLYVYGSLTPSTFDLAQGALRPLDASPLGRLVWYQTAPSRLPEWETQRRPWLHRPATVPRRSLAELSPERLARADAVVLPTKQLGRASGASVRAMLQEITPQISHVDRRPFHVRGPSLTVLVRPWTLVDVEDAELEQCGNGCFAGSIPGRAAIEEHASLLFWLPTTPGTAPPPATVRLDSGLLDLHFARARSEGWLYTSERFPARSEPMRFEVAGGPYRKPLAVEIYHWLPPEE